MMSHPTEKTFSLIGWICLLGDGLTGLMLLISPVKTLTLMGVQRIPAETVYVQYIGVFVLCAGLAYAVPRVFRNPEERLTAWRALFLFTAGLRICIALFVSGALMRGDLDRGWLSVPFYDASLALLQAVVLWRHVKR